MGSLSYQLAILIFNYASGGLDMDVLSSSGGLFNLRFRGAVTDGDFLYLTMQSSSN